MSLKLYEIADEYRAILSIMDLSDEDGIDADSFLAAIADIQADFSAKATNIGCLIREIVAESQAIGDTIKNLQGRAQSLDRRADRLREYLLMNMQAIGINRAADARIKLTLKNNPLSVRVDDPAAIPAEYCRIIPERREPDKTILKPALKAGALIPGCALIQTTRLDIK